MHSFDIFLVSLGSILGLGLLTSTIGKRTFLPRVTLLIFLGILLGDNGFNVLPDLFTRYFDAITQITLMMVGFLIGGKLELAGLKQSAKTVLLISLVAALITMAVVVTGLLLLGLNSNLALILGAIASATAPAAIIDIIEESKCQSYFCTTLLSVVAMDDIWALFLFAIALSAVTNLNGSADVTVLVHAAREIVGALTLGIVTGLPAAYLTGRIRSGHPMMLEALSSVFICGGLALWFGVSYLIACMTLGAVIVNLAKHHERPFNEIEHIEHLFLVVFFVVAGASLEVSRLSELGLLSIAFIVLRATGKYSGAWLGAVMARAPNNIQKNIPLTLFPQAGVSIGMALVASTLLPEHQNTILTLVIGSTVFFEIVGPIATRIGIYRAETTELRH